MEPSILDLVREAPSATRTPAPATVIERRMISDAPRPAPRPRMWSSAIVTASVALVSTIGVMSALSQRDRLAQAVPALEPIAAFVDRSAERFVDLTGAVDVSPLLTGSVPRIAASSTLAVRDVTSVRRRDDAGERLVVRGVVVNEADVATAPAPLSVVIRAQDGAPLYRWTVATGRTPLKKGEKRPFTAVSPFVPDGARDVAVRIAR